jgi:hypothetical protein
MLMGSNEFSAGAPSGTDPLAGASASAGTFLGAVSPAKGRVAALPEGVAFRLKASEGIMLNLHYINTGTEPADGEAYIDLKLAEIDPNRLSLPCSSNAGFSLAPATGTDSSRLYREVGHQHHHDEQPHARVNIMPPPR